MVSARYSQFEDDIFKLIFLYVNLMVPDGGGVVE